MHCSKCITSVGYYNQGAYHLLSSVLKVHAEELNFTERQFLSHSWQCSQTFCAWSPHFHLCIDVASKDWNANFQPAWRQYLQALYKCSLNYCSFPYCLHHCCWFPFPCWSFTKHLLRVLCQTIGQQRWKSSSCKHWPAPRNSPFPRCT